MRDQRGFVGIAVVVLLVIGLFMLLLCSSVKLSNEVVSGIVYNTSYDQPISGSTTFSIRAGENTPVTEENKSSYCLPAGSQYIDLIKKAAEDKRIKVVVTAHKYGFRWVAPWNCVNNVTVTQVQ